MFRSQDRFTISEVTADWHELMIPQHIMRPFIARASEQLDPQCSMQTYHHPNQLQYAFALRPVSYYSREPKHNFDATVEDYVEV